MGVDGTLGLWKAALHSGKWQCASSYSSQHSYSSVFIAWALKLHNISISAQLGGKKGRTRSPSTHVRYITSPPTMVSRKGQFCCPHQDTWDWRHRDWEYIWSTRGKKSREMICTGKRQDCSLSSLSRVLQLWLPVETKKAHFYHLTPPWVYREVKGEHSDC